MNPTKHTLPITRLYTGADGGSHFENIEVELDDHGNIGHLSAPRPATGLIFRHTDGDYHYDWHNAPQRQYIVILEGGLEIEVGDGTRRVFTAGDIVLAEDVEGQGHISRALDGKPRKSIFIII
ncbi:MAG: hypothetical protein VX929_08230 [Pseudomonadota bacterium]|nr:hypothetical protein [Pseudomonadota bacterium]